MGSASVRVVRGFILGVVRGFAIFACLAVLFGAGWGGEAFKLAKGINPRLVPVRPQKLQSVVPNPNPVNDYDIARHLIGPQNTLAGHLVLAPRAGTRQRNG